jgi:mycoredoxin
MPKKILMYSTTWCPDCHRTEKVLREHNAAFEKIDIEATSGAAEIVMGLANGKRVVPTLIMESEAGEKKVLINPRPQQLIDALNA